MRFVWVLFVLLASTTGLLSQSRYEIVGETLVFDMTIEEPGYDFTGEIETYDSTAIKNYLFDNPNIQTHGVTGPRGYGPAGREISAYLL